MRRRLLIACCTLASTGCGGTAVVDGGGGSEGTSTGGGGNSSCPVALTAIGEICVRGDEVDGGERIEEGSPLRVELTPLGCFSSSCTKILGGDCELTQSGATIQVGGSFCIREQAGQACTADCLDITLACNGIAIAPGAHTLVGPGDLELTIEVPSTVPLGGRCVGGSL